MQFISFNYNDRFDIFIVAIDFFLFKNFDFFFIETVFFSILFRNLERIYNFLFFFTYLLPLSTVTTHIHIINNIALVSFLLISVAPIW